MVKEKLSRQTAVKAALAAAAALVSESILDYFSPFDLSLLPPNLENIPIESNLPIELWGVSINAFGIWQADIETWNKLIKIMDRTGATILRISSLSGGFFDRQNETAEKLAQINRFFDFTDQKHIRVTFDFFDGFNGFQSDKLSGVYEPEKICEEKAAAERQNNKNRFFDDRLINTEFKESMRLYVDSIGHHRSLVAWTLANEIAPASDTSESIGKLNLWYLDKIKFLRGKLKDNRPIIFGLEDPTLIDEWTYKDFKKFTNLVHSLHWYPGRPHLIHKMKKIFRDSMFPLIIQEGGFPDYINLEALFPEGCNSRDQLISKLHKLTTGIDINLPEDILLPRLFYQAIEEATWGRKLLMPHIGLWGGWLNHSDGFLLDPDKQPEITKMMQTLARKFVPPAGQK